MGELITLAKALDQQHPNNLPTVAKELLRMTSVAKDTALHEAVWYNHVDVVKLMIKEDPELSRMV